MTATGAAEPARAAEPAGGRRPLLEDPNFLRLWLAGACGATARWLEMLAVGIFVFEVTGSAFLVAAMLMLRMLPLALFGAWTAEIAGRFDRRRVLLAVTSGLTVLSAVFAGLAFLGRLTVWHVAVGAFLTGIAWAMDFPVRRTLLADVAGGARLGAAMSLDTVASSGTRMAGPLLGGGLYATAGMDGAFLLMAVVQGFSLLILLGLPAAARHVSARAAGVVGALRTALSELRGLPAVQGVLAVTVVFNVWCFPVISMVPVLGSEQLRLGPFEIGVLASMEGLGSLLGAMGLAAFARHGQFRALFVLSVLLYLLVAVGFANATDALLAGTLLFVLGVSMAGFAAMQSTLMLLGAPDASRHRMMGLLSVFIGTGPIGFAHLGLLTAWLDTAVACTIVALEGLVALALVAWKWPLLGRQGQRVS